MNPEKNKNKKKIMFSTKNKCNSFNIDNI